MELLRIGISVALRARAHGLRRRQRHLGCLSLPDPRPRINDTADEPNDNGRHTTKGDRSIKENESTDGNRELVECAYHRIRSRRRHADTPRRAVRDENGAKSRVDHANEEAVTSLDWEIFFNVGRRPVLGQKCADDKHGNCEQVVVEHSCIPLLLVKPPQYW